MSEGGSEPKQATPGQRIATVAIAICQALSRVRRPLFLQIGLAFKDTEKRIAQVFARFAQFDFVLISSEDFKSFRPPCDDVAANLAADVSVGFASASESRI